MKSIYEMICLKKWIFGLLAVFSLWTLTQCSNQKNLEYLLSKEPHFQVSCGKLLSIDSLSSKFISNRNIEIWLPPDYDKNQKYPVLYMHDAQMLFDAGSTWNGQEWGVDEVLCDLFDSKTIQACIVVGIWNAGANRHSEYFPQKVFESLSKELQDSLYALQRSESVKLFGERVYSDGYLKFLTKELKPLIDKNINTLRGPENTFIAGSSMGGLISFYAAMEYPDVFGGAACISSHWPGIMPSDNNPIPEAFVQYTAQNLVPPSTNKWYFDFGTKSLDAYYEPIQTRIDSVFMAKGYGFTNWMTYKAEGADHSEKSWNARLEIPLSYLMNR